MKLKKEIITKLTNKIKKNNKTSENFATELKYLQDKEKEES